jgi:ABC-type nickel/cobalt efflux system permease component RcnA
LGNFTINHFNDIHVAADKISIDYVLDMAEIPAFQEMSNMDKGPDGKPAPAAMTAYAKQQCASIGGQLDLQDNLAPVAIHPTLSGVSFPMGAAGLSTLRLTCTFESAQIKVAANDLIDFADNTYPDRIGWREIVVSAAGIPLQGDFAITSISQELTSYPQDMLSSPLDVRKVSLKVGAAGDPAPGAQASKSAGQNTAPWSVGARSDSFTQLITLQDTTPLSILIAFIIAFVWGGLHSLTPGHGKTIVGAYLVGNRGTALHAVYLGLMTTVTHTAGVFLLGMVTLFASRYVLPDQLFPWISVLSGVLVVAIGMALFIGRLRTTRSWAGLVQRVRKPVQPAMAAPQRLQAGAAIQLSSITVASSGLGMAHGTILAATHTHADGSVHTHAGGLVHTHAHGEHSHLPLGADGSKVTLRSLLALGISGGLLPCPSALVVMLGAIALNRIGFGVLLVLVFSLGLACVLTGIGLTMVYARRFFDRLPVHSRFAELIPAGSALFITVLGIGITVQALAQMGWIAV